MPHPGTQRSIGLLLSGGLDSCILLGHLLDKGYFVQTIYVRSGLAWEADEQEAVRRFLGEVAKGLPTADSKEGAGQLSPLLVLDQPCGDLYEQHWSLGAAPSPSAATPDEAVFLPGRNCLLTLKPLLWCATHGIDRLALGVLQMNPFADATSEFFANWTAAIARATGRGVTLERPFATLGKRQVMLRGRRLPLELTFSCISPIGGMHCGRCNKCSERNAAFLLAELPDPTDYVYPDAVALNRRRSPMPEAAEATRAADPAESPPS